LCFSEIVLHLTRSHVEISFIIMWV